MGLRYYDDRKRYQGNIELAADKGYGFYDSLVMAADGAISIKNGPVIITKGSAAALTLVAPTAGVDDGKELHIVSVTAFAHTITTPANKINGNKAVATLGGAAGDNTTLLAYNGVWYQRGSTNSVLT